MLRALMTTTTQEIDQDDLAKWPGMTALHGSDSLPVRTGNAPSTYLARRPKAGRGWGGRARLMRSDLLWRGSNRHPSKTTKFRPLAFDCAHLYDLVIEVCVSWGQVLNLFRLLRLSFHLYDLATSGSGGM